MTAPAVSSGHCNQLDPVVNDLRSDEALAYPPVDVRKKLLNRPFPFAASGTAILQNLCPISRPSGYSDANACLWNAKADPLPRNEPSGDVPGGQPVCHCSWRVAHLVRPPAAGVEVGETNFDGFCSRS